MNGVYSIADIKKRLKPIFDTTPVYRATLFGSYARGDATDSSDIDIVIDSRGELLNIHFYGVLDIITDKLGKNVDLFEVSEIRADSPIHNEIELQGVLLYDR